MRIIPIKKKRKKKNRIKKRRKKEIRETCSIVYMYIHIREKFNYARHLCREFMSLAPSINFETKSDFANCRTSEPKLSETALPASRCNKPEEFHGFG